MARGCLAAIASILLIGLTPAGADAAIRIYENSEAATYLGKIKKARCKVVRDRNHFHAAGKTTNGRYEFGVDIYDFTNFRRDYLVPFGVINPTVDLEGAGQDYSNNYPFPGGQPPGSAGEIAFGKRGAKLGVGVYALPNADYSRGVALAGALDCIYRRR